MHEQDVDNTYNSTTSGEYRYDERYTQHLGYSCSAGIENRLLLSNQ